MSEFPPPGYGRLGLRLCAAAAVTALLAGCSSDTTRLSDPFSNPFSTAANEPVHPTASHRATGLGRQPPVVSQALPVRSTAVASVAPLRPNLTRSASLQPVSHDVTGSIDPAPLRSVRTSTSGGWTSSGGVPVTVAEGDTSEVLSRRYGVPAAVLLQTNGLASSSDLKPGSTITIPVYNAVAAAQQPAPVRTVQAEPAIVRAVPAVKSPAPLARASLLKPRAERMAAAQQRKTVAPAKPLPVAAAEKPVPVAAVEKQAHVRPVTAAAAPAIRTVQTTPVEVATVKPATRKEGQVKLGSRAGSPVDKRVAAKSEPAPTAPVKSADVSKPVAAVKTAQAAPAKISEPAPAKTAAKPAPAVKPAPVKTAAASPPAEVPPVAKAEPAPAVGSASASNTTVADASGNPEFRWPARGRIIQGFKGGNDGINIAVPEGTAVKAAEGGTVAYAGSELKGYGNLVLIRHPNGYVTAYANNGEIDVKRGDQVKRGQVIAKSGQSGNVASPQLHFELRKGSTPVDPTSYLAGL